MEIEVQVVNDECNGFNTISLNLELDKTIGDIINNLDIINSNNNNNNNNNLLLYHLNSGIIFNDDITINECIKQLNITANDKLSFNLAKMFKSPNNEVKIQKIKRIQTKQIQIQIQIQIQMNKS